MSPLYECPLVVGFTMPFAFDPRALHYFTSQGLMFQTAPNISDEWIVGPEFYCYRSDRRVEYTAPPNLLTMRAASSCIQRATDLNRSYVCSFSCAIFVSFRGEFETSGPLWLRQESGVTSTCGARLFQCILKGSASMFPSPSPPPSPPPFQSTKFLLFVSSSPSSPQHVQMASRPILWRVEFRRSHFPG